MAISKLVLNGDVQMDVTSDTVSANRMLNGYTATKNDGTKVTGNIATKSATDMTTSGSTVTAAAGYYATATSKNVGAGSAFTPAVTITKNPTISLTSSTGAVTASYAGSSSVTPTVTAGYVAAGTAGTVSTSGTSTYQLTSKAAATYNTSTADQTIGSYQWLTGNQTIKSVTTSNLTAGNIANGVVVKVGDANNASRITQITGTYAPAVSSVTVTPTETAQTFNATGVYGYKPVTINAISSTYVGTGVDRRDGENTTFTESTGAFYGPSGYYTEAFTRMITTQAAQTIYPSTADQTVASYKWLTGTQTIKSVTTSNLTAANIAEGVVVKVGDSTNASRIAQITGTHSGETSYTATITGATGSSSYCYVTYAGTKRYGVGATFTFKAGETLTIYCRGNNVTINGDNITLSSYSYTYTLPVGDITIDIAYSSSTNNSIAIYSLIQPTGTYSVSAAGNHNVYKYSVASIPTGSAFPPSTTITTNPSFTLVSSTAKITAAYNGTSYVTPTVTSGWVAAGTSGVISTTGTSTFTLTSQAAQTFYPSTADQTVTSYRWLTGTQTFKSVTTTNLTAANIAEGVVVKVGDANNASRIVQITGTHQGGGGGFTVDQIAMRTISGSISGNATNIGSYAFGCCSSLTSVSFPSATFIDSDAFAFCYGLISVSFPLVVSIGNSAFGHCSSLTSVSFPSATSIGSDAFYFCYSLISVSFPLVVSIGNSAFAYCRNLTSVNFPSATRINDYAFTYCSSLTSVSFPLVASISSYAFSNCRNLTSVSFPLVASIGGYAFAYCYSLTFVSFPSATFIDNFAFRNCYHLLSVYLMGSSVPTLYKSNVFSSTPISNYTTSTGGVYGSIFVPTSLYNSYITATNWSVYSARIVSV